MAEGFPEGGVCMSDLIQLPDGGEGQIRDDRSLVSLREYFYPVVSRWPVVLAFTLLAPALVLAVDFAMPPDFEAEAEVLIIDDPAESMLIGTDTNTMRRRRQLVTDLNLADSDEVGAETRRRLGLAADAELPTGSVVADGDVDRRADDDANFLIFTSRGSTAEQAAVAADAWASAFIQVRRDQRISSIDQAIEEVRTVMADLAVSRDQLLRRQMADEQRLVGDDIQQIDGLLDGHTAVLNDLETYRDIVSSSQSEVLTSARQPTAPVGGAAYVSVATAVAVGFMIGVAVTVLLSGLQKARRDADPVGRGYGRGHAAPADVVGRGAGGQMEAETSRARSVVQQ